MLRDLSATYPTSVRFELSWYFNNVRSLSTLKKHGTSWPVTSLLTQSWGHLQRSGRTEGEPGSEAKTALYGAHIMHRDPLAIRNKRSAPRCI